MKYAVALAAAIFATPAVAQVQPSAAEPAAPVYGPPAPQPRALPADMPERFTMRPEETVEQAVDRTRRVRREAKRTAFAGLALSGIDAVQTCILVGSGRAQEGNPLLGKHPSCAKVAGFKVITGGLFLFAFDKALKRDPYQARRNARIFVAVQGSVVVANMRLVF